MTAAPRQFAGLEGKKSESHKGRGRSVEFQRVAIDFHCAGRDLFFACALEAQLACGDGAIAAF